MLEGVLILLSPALIVFLLIRFRCGMPFRVAFTWAVLGVYALWAADLLFFPLIIDAKARAADAYFAGSMGRWVNVVPFSTIIDQLRLASPGTARQLFGNLGLLLPLGLFGPVVVRSLRSLGRLALTAVAVSVAIELVQMVGTLVRVLDRSVDIDDVILNTVGALTGWLLWRVASALTGSAADE